MTGRAHIKEICWKSYSHLKIAAACIALSLDNEHYGYSSRDRVIEHLGVHMRTGNKGSLSMR